MNNTSVNTQTQILSPQSMIFTFIFSIVTAIYIYSLSIELIKSLSFPFLIISRICMLQIKSF